MPPSEPRSVVLVVEDEALQRIHLVWLLEQAGFLVLEAANADAALTLLNTHPNIRLVVTDVDVPGSIDGFRLAHMVRDRWPPIELIVISGRYTFAPGELPSRGRFLVKPYSERRLLDLATELTTM